MRMNPLFVAVSIAIVLGAVSAAEAQVAECAQAHPVVNATLDAALKRLEEARQTNSASAMRAATDAVQAAIVDVRSQLAPCGRLQQEGPAGGHAGHNGPASPNTQQAPDTPGTPAMAPGLPTPAPGAPRPGASAAPRDPHAGHTMPDPAVAKPASVPAPPPPMTTEPRASAETTVTGAMPATSLGALKCAAEVDPKVVPRMLYQGRMYYFCSEQDRSEFAKEPTKYKTESAPAQPAHAH